MAATTNWYALAAKHLLQGEVVWDSDTIKVALATSSYVPNQDADEFFSNVTHELAASGGYVAGGNALTGKTHSFVGNQERLGATNVVFSSLAPSAPFRIAVIYKATGFAATSPLLGWVDYGSDQNPLGNDFVISWSALGVLTIFAA